MTHTERAAMYRAMAERYPHGSAWRLRWARKAVTHERAARNETTRG